MGCTTGLLSGNEEQTITITIPGSLTRDKADALAAALNAVVHWFNAQHTNPGGPKLEVVST